MLRRASMLADALSHAVLPGIVGAFMLTGSMHPVVLMGGAALAGVVTALLVSWLHRQAQLATDVALGITFTAFFALGIVLVCLYTRKTDLDVGCVLYGKLVMMAFDVWVWQGYALGPQAVWILLGLLVVNAAFVTVGYKQLLLTSFDADLAALAGINGAGWHYALMVLTSITTVLALKSVGAVLVVGFLVGPPAIALMVADRLPQLLAYTVLINGLVVALGYKLASWSDGSVPGAMMVAVGMVFALALAYSQRRQLRT